MLSKSLYSLKTKKQTMKLKKPHYLIFSILICQLAGIIGGLFTSSSVNSWYKELVKPSFNPPSWVFSPVWITLYLLMGVSLYLIWIKKKNKQKNTALTWFYIQLGLNILWSILFFGLKQPLLAFVEIIVLDFAILMTMIKSYRLSKTACYLMLPYILWVSFAAVLNFMLFYLN